MSGRPLRIECRTQIKFQVIQPPSQNVLTLLKHIHGDGEDNEPLTCTAIFDTDRDAKTGGICARRILSTEGITITSDCRSCLCPDTNPDFVAQASRLHRA